MRIGYFNSIQFNSMQYKAQGHMQQQKIINKQIKIQKVKQRDWGRLATQQSVENGLK